MTDADYRRYTTAELREAATDPDARFESRFLVPGAWVRKLWQPYYLHDGTFWCWVHRTVGPWDYLCCSNLAKRKLRRIA